MPAGKLKKIRGLQKAKPKKRTSQKPPKKQTPSPPPDYDKLFPLDNVHINDYKAAHGDLNFTIDELIPARWEWYHPVDSTNLFKFRGAKETTQLFKQNIPPPPKIAPQYRGKDRPKRSLNKPQTPEHMKDPDSDFKGANSFDSKVSSDSNDQNTNK